MSRFQKPYYIKIDPGALVIDRGRTGNQTLTRDKNHRNVYKNIVRLKKSTDTFVFYLLINTST